MNQNVHLISLGCPKNLVDSEYLLGSLVERGMSVVEDPEEADVILINTCAFIQSAVEESIDTILQAVQLRENGTVKRVIVFGCLPQRYQDELGSAMGEVDLIWGSGRLDRLVDAIINDAFSATSAQWSSPGFLPAGPAPRLRSAPFYSAYLKIAEGCSNNCTYCLIPKLRGGFRSRDPRMLVDEAAALASSGVRELILVAQDTTAYGHDLGNQYALADLLSDLAQIPDLKWLRVMYAYPTGLTDPLVEVMAGEPKVLPYLDLPLQHASPNVLRRMGRLATTTGLEKRIHHIRSKIPDLVIRTTMMVGFPGETEDDFNILTSFCQNIRFDRLGVFKFSSETGIPASEFPDQVPQRIKENRRRKLMALQRRISREVNRKLKGKTVPVLIEGRSPETDLLLIGRTAGQAPQIDGQVLINKGIATAGEIRLVQITETHDYDLVGEIADHQ